MSVYDALPDRPVVFHVAADTPMGDACLVFFEGSMGSQVEVIEVKSKEEIDLPYLTRFDLLRFIILCDDPPVIEWTVEEYLVRFPHAPRTHLELVNERGEASLDKVLANILSEGSGSIGVPIVALSESKLKSIFGYVGLNQILACCISGSVEEFDVLQFSLPHQTCEIPFLSTNASIKDLINVLVHSTSSLVALSESGMNDRLLGVVTIDSVISALSSADVTPIDHLLQTSVSSIMTSKQAINDQEPVVAFSHHKDFPLSLRHGLEKILLNTCKKIVVLGDSDILVSVIGLHDLFNTVLIPIGT